ncbi:class I SAM-dependent methyltransferase [Vulcaniibacterium gelatinicum]|uniref:class I SAM-dependent methyltransferase n=1 Tax=Vulcaniibacterium gelatinicum TaxID=2598725 RepID=UPI0011CB9CB9|nr:methyltransferase domain-containing protein [Vulcaniibacterium gelatinicum]
MNFQDHFSTVAAEYAGARPDYPPALFAWIASVAPARALVWEAGCGSGQASRDLAAQFARVHATDPSAAQIAQAQAPGNVRFAVEAGERCSLPDACADAVCVAQALHWFDRAAFFADTARHRARTGQDPVAMHAEALRAAWGDPERPRTLRWPLFVHARRKEA